MKTTAGQILIESGLPEELQDPSRPWDQKRVYETLEWARQRGPATYSRVANHLHRAGARLAHSTGVSLSLKDFIPDTEFIERRNELRRRYMQTLADKGPAKALAQLAAESDKLTHDLFEYELKRGNPLALQIQSGARGNKQQLRGLMLGDFLAQDHRNRPIEAPIWHSYSEGLTPLEYWSSSYGSRKGLIATKLATQDAGGLGKQLVQAAHRIRVGRGAPLPGIGMVVDSGDAENEGSVLAQDVGPIKAGTILDRPTIEKLSKLARRVLVHSAAFSSTEDGRIPREGAGVRERGDLSPAGENIGLLAAQAVSERLSQTQLKAKHGSQLATSGAQTISGFNLIKNMLQVPRNFPGGAALSQVDGAVTRVEKAPQGGHYVWVGQERHYVDEGIPISVKVGQSVERGDILGDGIPNPADLARLRGIGEGRRLFIKYFTNVLRQSGIPIHRRNIEVLARAMINHVEATDPIDHVGALPGDIVEYDTLAQKWVPREGASLVSPDSAVGKYLEAPVLHHSIGTRISPSMLADMRDMGVKKLLVHDTPPPFKPAVKRVMEHTSYSPDWGVRMMGSYLERGLLEAAHRGRYTDTSGQTSYVPPILAGEL